MAVKYYVVDAFTDTAFKGNPAAVCLLEEQRDEVWMQQVAREFNLSETCYLIRIPTDSPAQNPQFSLRWFTPAAEVKLCGHATLAAAHTMFSSGLVKSNTIEFFTLSGVLYARRFPKTNRSDGLNCQNSDTDGNFFVELDFPASPLVDCSSAEVSSIHKSLSGTSVIDTKKIGTSDDLLAELSSAKAVADFQPKLDEIVKFPGIGFIITGLAPPDSGFDFFSRYFAPQIGVGEDPVCGSAHCAIAPYWSKKLGKCDFVAYQASPRGGVLHLRLDEHNQRVFIRGEAVGVMEGSLLV